MNDKILIDEEQDIIENVNILTNKKIKKLLYRASKDGFKSSDFHRKCDGHSNTIVIIKIRNKNIIGGYTRIKWESSKKGEYMQSLSRLSSVFLNILK